MMRRRAIALALSAALPLAACVAPAAEPASAACGAIAGEAGHAVQLLFGRAIGTQGEVSEAEWRDFLARVVTPAFPDGLTVLDAQGQWRDSASGAVVSEPSKIVLVVVPDLTAAMPRVAAVADAYKARFSQQAVGIVVTGTCAAFR